MLKLLKNTLIVSILFATATSSLVSAESTFNLSNDKEQKIEAYIEKWRKEWNVPTVQLGIIENDQLSVNKTFGTTIAQDKTLKINSMSKVFTAYGIMLLVQNGQLSLDDPLSKYLPGFAVANNNVTVRNLLNHTSGLMAYDGDTTLYSHTYTSVDSAAIALKDLAPDISQIGKFQYSSVGYLFLGDIIEKVSHMDYADYMNKYVFGPVGMSQTSLADDDTLSPGYTTFFGFNLPFDDHYSVGDGPFEGIHTTVGDIAKFLVAQTKNSPLQSKYAEMMQVSAPPVQYYTSPTALQSLGWGLEPAGPKTNTPLYIFHDGTGRGYQSEMSIEPSTGFGIVLLTNKIWYADDSMAIPYLFWGIQDIRDGKVPADIKPSHDILKAIGLFGVILVFAIGVYLVTRIKRQTKRKRLITTVGIILILVGFIAVPLFVYLEQDPFSTLVQYIPDEVVTVIVCAIETVGIGTILLQRSLRKNITKKK